MHIFRIHRTLAAALVLLLIAIPGQARRLMELDGIELRGTARVLTYGAATCHILEEKYSAEDYARLKENEGQPLDLWQLDFSVYNGSGKALDHLIARYRIESPWPPCTNWSYAPGTRANEAAWDSDSGHIQRTGKPYSVSPGETVTKEILLIAFHEDEPRFDRWSVDYNFAEVVAPAADGQDTPARAEAPTAQPAPTQAVAPSPTQAPDLPSGVTAGDTCTGKPKGSSCWMELDNQSGCYLWNPNLQENETVTWSGACASGLAEGFGDIVWIEGNNREISTKSTGQLQQGKHHGYWVLHDDADGVDEGFYVDGKRHGQWILRVLDAVFEGPYVDGKRHGQWVFRWATGDLEEGLMVDGEKHGRWVWLDANGKIKGESTWENGRLLSLE